jgi:microcystin-dependent protein
MNGIVGFTILFAGNFAPGDWAICDGSLLSVAANPVLFSVIGNVYGGDGIRTFALPDLRGRAIVGAGKNDSLYKPGYKGGAETLSPLETKHIPAHTHAVNVTIVPKAAETANASSPAGAAYATNPNQQMYNFDTDTAMASYKGKITTSAIGNADPQPVPVLHPVLALNYIICLKTAFPRRDREENSQSC